MERVSSWLISIFITVFWIFRVVVAIFAQTESDFSGFIVFDFSKEIILIFVTLISIILIFKRKLFGAILYIITYGYYFGGYLYTNTLSNLAADNNLSGELFQNSIISILAIILSVIALLDLVYEKVRKNKYNDSKTDWFFEDKKTDRKLDNKADTNQYKIY